MITFINSKVPMIFTSLKFKKQNKKNCYKNSFKLIRGTFPEISNSTIPITDFLKADFKKFLMKMWQFHMSQGRLHIPHSVNQSINRTVANI